jgi:DNA-damage-inducible protein J
MANVNIRVDDVLKKQTESILNDLGLNLSVATTAFYKQVVRCGGIPFELRVTDPFYSGENQRRLAMTLENYTSGKSKPVHKTLNELEKLADV